MEMNKEKLLELICWHQPLTLWNERNVLWRAFKKEFPTNSGSGRTDCFLNLYELRSFHVLGSLFVNLKQNCFHHLFWWWVATWVWYLYMVFCSSLKSVLGQYVKWLLPQHVTVIFIYPLLLNCCLNMGCTYVVARCFSLLQAQTTQRNVMYSAGALFFGKFWVARNLLMILGAQHFALCGLSTQGNDHP
jgi:hypothetical protein